MSEYQSALSEPRRFAQALNERLKADGFETIPMSSPKWADRVIAYIDHLRERAK
jgi:hypothetical protein